MDEELEQDPFEDDPAIQAATKLIRQFHIAE